MAADKECRHWHFDGAHDGMCVVSNKWRKKDIAVVPIKEARDFEVEAINWKENKEMLFHFPGD